MNLFMLHFQDTCNRTIGFLDVETLHSEHYRASGQEVGTTIDDVDPKFGAFAVVFVHPNA